jgi:hypothetical protein
MASRQTGKCLIFNTLVEVVSKSGEHKKIPIGMIFYNELKNERKLTLLEKIKIKLYYLIYLIENS